MSVLQDDVSKLKTAIFDLVVVVALGLLTTILRGVVLSYLWLWFIVPFGIPPIGIAHALGVSVLVTFLTYHDVSVKQERHPTKTRIGLSIFFPLAVFLFGYIYHIYV